MSKSNKTKKLDKEKLDSMSKNEIEKYRMDFIKNSTWSSSGAGSDLELSNKQYLAELEIYNEIRFKEDTYEMFDRWCVKSDDNKLKNIKDGLLQLNVSILKRENGYDFMYYMTLIEHLKKVGEFQYIKGINIDIPEEYRQIFKYDK